jgi:hypothetical protein
MAFAGLLRGLQFGPELLLTLCHVRSRKWKQIIQMGSF